ncbi:MAG: hypothetical protein M0R17_04955 [Candidatus Omnitrophica bacterium]|jgi:hypothetical protein|nr:hypothetical protein [Candidatus Omnitrophota bacterium]
MKTTKELLSQIRKDAFRSNLKYHKVQFYEQKESLKLIKFVNGLISHYSHHTGIDKNIILDALESNRTYWSLNYYQRANFPRIDNIAIFETLEDFKLKFPSGKFVCPLCGGHSTNPYECNTKLKAKTNSGICDWKSYGLFGCIGKGYTFTIKTEFIKTFKTNTIFKPIELL